MALPKKYFKLHPGKLKAAWAHYRRDKKARSSGKKTTAKKSTKKKSTKKKIYKEPTKKKSTKRTGGTTMAKAKSKAKKTMTKIKYRAISLKPLDLLIRALIGAGGGVTSSFIVNSIPGMKTRNPFIKSGVQMAVGIGSLFIIPKKFDLVKYLAVGAFTAGTYGMVGKIIQKDVLAGDADLTKEEIQALLSSGFISGPAEMKRLNGPVNLARMGAGENPSMMGAGENPNMMGNSGFRM